MKAAVIQMSVGIAMPEKNLETGLGRIREAAKAGAGLIVMPEMWVTGLHPGVVDSPFVEMTPEIIEKISAIASESGAVIVAGSLAWRDGASMDRRVFNRVFVIDGSGALRGTYDKIQVFTRNNEHHYSRPGARVSVVEAGGTKIAPFVCFDLRFPELFRMTAMAGAEIIVVSSQFPASRIGHWRAMLPARAVENQAYLLASNVCGHDGLLELGGRSAIVSYSGEVLAECSVGEEATVFAEIDIEAMRSYRAKFPFLEEAAARRDLLEMYSRPFGAE